MMSRLGAQHKQRAPATLTRRAFLAAAGAAAPFTIVRRAGAAGRVVVRTFGGAYEDALIRHVFEPYTKATGVEVLRVPANSTKIYAMLDAGKIEIDLLDTGEYGGLILRQRGG